MWIKAKINPSMLVLFESKQFGDE